MPFHRNEIILGGRVSIKYLLYDTFATALAAGAVNGTASEPGPNALANAAPTRTVTDTGSNLSIASNKLRIAASAGTLDPKLVYADLMVTRVAGRSLIYQITSGAAVLATVGFASSATPTDGVIRNSLELASASPAFFVRESAATTNVGVAATSGTYTMAVVLRATGAWYFIKGGAFTNWTLVWVSVANNTASLFAVFASYVGNVNNDNDNIRIPQSLYIPNPLAYDTFTRANGALGSTETAGPDAQAIAALAWAFTAGVWAIVSNVAVATPTLGADVIVNGGFAADTDWSKGAGWTIAGGVAVATAATSNLTQAVAPLTTNRWYSMTFTLAGFTGGTAKVLIGTNTGVSYAANGTYTNTTLGDTTAAGIVATGLTGTIDNVSCQQIATADLFASVTVSTQDVVADVSITLPSAAAGIQAGLVLNLDSVATPANFVLAYLNGNGFFVLCKVVAGVYTVVQATIVTYIAGAVLRVIKSGTSYSLFYNNAAVGTVQTIADAGIVNNTKHGLFSTSPLNSLDNFTLWPRGTSNEYAGLDAF